MVKIDTTADTGAYILGLLWGTMSTWEDGFWLRHRDRWYIDTCKKHLNISVAVQKVVAHGGTQYRLKIIRAKKVQEIQSLLESRGWTPRKASERPYPSGSLNDRGFIRAWVELHGTIDIRQAKHRNGNYYPQKRLRIYGNWALMEEMNYILCAGAGLKPRTIQRTTNEVTKYIVFQGSSVAPVVDWLYLGAEIWNSETRKKLEFSK